MARDYKELKIWQKGIDIVDKVYSVTASFPKEELYSLSSQMKRAAVSIPSNIAEGFARQSNREYKQFLYVSLGSCAELETQTYISYKRKYIAEKTHDELLEELNHESRMLMALIKQIK